MTLHYRTVETQLHNGDALDVEEYNENAQYREGSPVHGTGDVADDSTEHQDVVEGNGDGHLKPRAAKKRRGKSPSKKKPSPSNKKPSPSKKAASPTHYNTRQAKSPVYQL